VDYSALLAALEDSGDEDSVGPALAFLGGRDLAFDRDELNGALRRALFLVAAGGDPHRLLEPHGRAVTALAAELEQPHRLTELDRGLEALRPQAEPFPVVAATLDELLADPALAWRAYACALLAAELTE
jgi:hypothetical protein